MQALLGGSWVVISGVISRVTLVLAHITGRITPLITTHEPPSMPLRGSARSSLAALDAAIAEFLGSHGRVGLVRSDPADVELGNLRRTRKMPRRPLSQIA